MPKVFQLGYVAVGTKNFDQTREYYLETLGTTELDRGDDGCSYLSIGFGHHDMVLKPTGERSLLHLGYQLNPGTDLADFAREVTAYGLSPKRKSDSQPGVRDLVEVEGPGENVFQFFESIETPAPGFKSSGVSPLRLGHVAVISPDAEKLIAFYRDFLGFWETDWIGDVANFLTCNTDHHVINIVNAPPSGIHHIAFQLQENAHHSRAADRLRASGIQTKWGPSRHTAGHNLAAYHYDPNDMLIELYTDMDVFVPELGFCQPRPWHEHFPMKPKHWGLDELSGWGVDFQFDLARG
jgi:catechol-2,3-dioxygenase